MIWPNGRWTHIKGRYKSTTWHWKPCAQSLIEEATIATEWDTTSENLDSSFCMSNQSESELFENKTMLIITAILESKHVLQSWFISLCYGYFFKAASHVQQILLLKSWHMERFSDFSSPYMSHSHYYEATTKITSEWQQVLSLVLTHLRLWRSSLN